MSTTFRVAGTFDLPGRGTVVFGDVVEGTIVKGMHVTLPDGSTWPIAAVEYIDYPARLESHVAVVLRAAPCAKDLSGVVTPGTVIGAR